MAHRARYYDRFWVVLFNPYRDACHALRPLRTSCTLYASVASTALWPLRPSRALTALWPLCSHSRPLRALRPSRPLCPLCTDAWSLGALRTLCTLRA